MTAREAHRRGLPKPAVAADSKPYCFVSFSTREAHVPILVDCLRIVLGSNFEVKLTPSALESGASQRGQIVSLIEDSAFAVVILDGLKEAVSSFQPENLDRPTPGSKTLA